MRYSKANSAKGTFMNKPKSEKQIRFEKEAKALQKNLEKRKKQQLARQQLKKAKEQPHGQD